MKKTLISLVAVGALFLSLAACGEPVQPVKGNAPTESQTTEKAPTTAPEPQVDEPTDKAAAPSHITTFGVPAANLVKTLQTVYKDTAFDNALNAAPLSSGPNDLGQIMDSYTLVPGVVLNLFKDEVSGELSQVMVHTNSSKVTSTDDAKLFGGLITNLLTMFESDSAKQSKIEKDLNLGDFSTVRTDVAIGSIATWTIDVSETTTTINILA